MLMLVVFLNIMLRGYRGAGGTGRPKWNSLQT